jgi:hypothetical protein
MDTSQLVNWDPKAKKFKDRGGWPPQDIQTFLKGMEATRHPAIVKLVDAITAFWERMGTRELSCGPCHAKDQDCCTNCTHLGKTGCVAKPIPCALYICGSKIVAHHPPVVFAKIKEFVFKLQDELYKHNLFMGYRDIAYRAESKLLLTAEQVVFLRDAARRVQEFNPF